MSASRVAERRAAYALQTAMEPALGTSFDLLATAPQGVAKLRELILSLAVRGRLVAQLATEESAGSALEKHRQLERLNQVRAKGNHTAILLDGAKTIGSGLPASWELVRVAEVVEILDSLRKPVTKADRKPGPYPYYGSSGIVDHVSGYIFDEPLVLVGEDGAKWGAGDSTAFLVAGKTWVNNHAHVLRPVRTLLQDEFLAHALNAMDLGPYITGMTVPKLNQARLNSVTVALPPLAEQARIVARVEELMQLCDALEAQGRLQDEQHARLVATLFDTLAASESAGALAESWQRLAAHFDLLIDRPEAVDTLAQILLQLAVRGSLVAQDPTDEPASELITRIRKERCRLDGAGEAKRKKSGSTGDDEQPFGLPPNWAWVSFNDIVRPDKPIAYGVLVPGPDSTDGVPFVRLADISLTDPPARPAKSISLDVDAQFVRTRLDGGEILIGVVGSIGKLGVAPMSWKGANIARAICRIVPTDLVDKGYILQLLQSEFMQSRFRGDTRTLAQPTLNVGLIRDCPTPLPPLAEQHRIVARVEQLRGLCADLRERLQQSRATQSRLANALVADVAGQRVCGDPAKA